MPVRFDVLSCSCLLLVACAAQPLWKHRTVTDPSQLAAKLRLDDAECSALSAQPNAVIPPAAATSPPQAYRGTFESTDSRTGTRTTGTYTAQPISGGFGAGMASGLASGAAIGAAFAAARREEQLHKSCMVARGWYDSTEQERLSSTVEGSKAKVALRAPLAYADGATAWKAATEEFWAFFPEFKSNPNYDKLNVAVKTLAQSRALDGPQYLVEARDILLRSGDVTHATPEDDLSRVYARASGGDAVAKARMAYSYAVGQDRRTTGKIDRGAYWAREAAIAGEPRGQLGYGILLFSGGVGGREEKVLGYQWVKRAELNGLDVRATLEGFRGDMTEDEVRQAQK